MKYFLKLLDTLHETTAQFDMWVLLQVRLQQVPALQHSFHIAGYIEHFNKQKSGLHVWCYVMLGRHFVKESEYVNWAKMTWAIAGDSFHVHFQLRSFLCTVFIEVVCIYVL